MVVVRLALFAVLGALFAAGALYGFQLYVWKLGNVDLSGVGLTELMTRWMRLPEFAAFGAVVGLLLAPFPGRGLHPFWRLIGWTVAGSVLGLAVPTLRALVALGHLPTTAEAVARLTFDPKYLIAGAAVGLALSWVETGRELLEHTRLRRRLAHVGTNPLNDPDAAIKEYWRERAESYLAHRAEK
jgi:hypothetical protein